MSLLDAERDRITRMHRLQSDNLRPIGDRLDACEQALAVLCRIKGIEPEPRARMAEWPGGIGEKG